MACKCFSNWPIVRLSNIDRQVHTLEKKKLNLWKLWKKKKSQILNERKKTTMSGDGLKMNDDDGDCLTYVFSL